MLGNVRFGACEQVQAIHDLFQREELHCDEDEQVTYTFDGLGGFIIEKADVGLSSTDFGMVDGSEQSEEAGGGRGEPAVEEEEDDFEEAELLAKDLLGPEGRVTWLLTYGLGQREVDEEAKVLYAFEGESFVGKEIEDVVGEIVVVVLWILCDADEGGDGAEKVHALFKVEDVECVEQIGVGCVWGGALRRLVRT